MVAGKQRRNRTDRYPELPTPVAMLEALQAGEPIVLWSGIRSEGDERADQWDVLELRAGPNECDAIVRSVIGGGVCLLSLNTDGTAMLSSWPRSQALDG